MSSKDRRHLFTSESVTEGHPDKICDQISDGILDAILANDPMARVACETSVTTGLVLVAGEITTNCYVDIPRMADLGLSMLKDGLDSFVNGNVKQALAVIPRDKEVDAINKQLHRELVSYMIERPPTITRCLSLMVVSKSLERIADHATNIAEEVVYLYEGRDIRHTGKSSATQTA